MFGVYLKSSIKALPVLVLLPLAVFVLYLLVIDPYYVQYYTVSNNELLDVVWQTSGRELMIFSMIAAVIANLLFLMIIPSAIGGTDSGKKRGQFYLGFFCNLFFTLLLPCVYFSLYMYDAGTFAILTGLHAASFLAAFIAGSFLVAPAYSKAFWFVNRN
jgi:hypothetical protein